MIYELKVTLKDVGVPVWRNIQIDSSTTFYELHRTIQIAFDWEDYHLHEFMPTKTNGNAIRNVAITQDNDVQEEMMAIHDEKYNEHESVLSDWFQQAKDKVLYIYDFGDDWMHDIVLMKAIKRKPNKTYPCCTKIRNLPPPEDSRGELIQGEIELESNDTEQLLINMNEIMNQEIDDSVSEDLLNDYWPEVLSKAKAFSKLKPWERMADNDIFAVVDPVTEETLFCSILGANETTFGLGVYIGAEGYSALNDTMNGSDNDFEIMLRQRSLLLSFVNRESIDKIQYDLIKTYDVPFRGRNAWPEFISMKPGSEPWYFDNEEARMMLLAIGETIDVYHQVKGGLELPKIYNGDQVFAKVPVDKDGTTFENKMLDLTVFNEEALAPPIVVSEFELKRIQKIKSVLSLVLEFSMVHLDMPVQNSAGARPELPVLVIAVDQQTGSVYYKNLLPNSFDTRQMQRELLNLIETLGGRPERILMDPNTAYKMDSVNNEMDLNVEVSPVLPLVQEVVDGLNQHITDM